MSRVEKDKASRWVDDHLDLYNLAKTLGDAEWQQRILHTLRDQEIHLYEENKYSARLALWLRFDRINRQMLNLYEQLRTADYSESEKRQLREKVWEFKLQRVRIAGKLRAQ